MGVVRAIGAEVVVALEDLVVEGDVGGVGGRQAHGGQRDGGLVVLKPHVLRHDERQVWAWAPASRGQKMGFPPPDNNELVFYIETGCTDTVSFPPELNTPL